MVRIFMKTHIFSICLFEDTIPFSKTLLEVMNRLVRRYSKVFEIKSCRYVLFKRQHDNLPTCQLCLFHTRYPKDIAVGPSENLNLFVQPYSWHAEHLELDLTDGDKSQVQKLNSQEKYNLILPVALNIASLQFQTYLNAIKTVGDLVRTGASISCVAR